MFEITHVTSQKMELTLLSWEKKFLKNYSTFIKYFVKF